MNLALASSSALRRWGLVALAVALVLFAALAAAAPANGTGATTRITLVAPPAR